MGRKLTIQQEGFCQSIVDGKLNQADCYRANYDCSNMLRQSVDQLASRLANHVKIRSRVAELREPVASALMAKLMWDAERLVDQAEVNLTGAREDHAWAPANRAIELIARLTGNLEPTAGTQEVHITKVTVVLPPGTPVVDAGRDIVDAESYNVLPSGDEGADQSVE